MTSWTDTVAARRAAVNAAAEDHEAKPAPATAGEPTPAPEAAKPTVDVDFLEDLLDKLVAARLPAPSPAEPQIPAPAVAPPPPAPGEAPQGGSEAP